MENNKRRPFFTEFVAAVFFLFIYLLPLIHPIKCKKILISQKVLKKKTEITKNFLIFNLEIFYITGHSSDSNFIYMLPTS